MYMSLLFIILLLLSGESFAEATFEPPVRINDDPLQINFHDTYSSGQRSIAVKGKNVAIVWNDIRNGNNDVFFSFAGDGGKTFSKTSALMMITRAAISGMPKLLWMKKV